MNDDDDLFDTTLLTTSKTKDSQPNYASVTNPPGRMKLSRINPRSKEGSVENSIDLAELQNFAFYKMRLPEVDADTKDLHWRKTIGAKINEFKSRKKIKSCCSDEASELRMVSQFPNVSNIPIDLQPFKKKLQMVQIVQQRNEKRYFHDLQIFNKLGIQHKYKKQLEEELKAQSNNSDPNAINENKVKLWSHLIAKKKERFLKDSIEDDFIYMENQAAP